MSRPTPGAILEALREAVTIIEPGEILAVRVDPRATDAEFDEMRQRAEQVSTDHGVTVLLLAGEEFARLKRGDPS
jgi:hypothetical protein